MNFMWLKVFFFASEIMFSSVYLFRRGEGKLMEYVLVSLILVALTGRQSNCLHLSPP